MTRYEYAVWSYLYPPGTEDLNKAAEDGWEMFLPVVGPVVRPDSQWAGGLPSGLTDGYYAGYFRREKRKEPEPEPPVDRGWPDPHA